MTKNKDSGINILLSILLAISAGFGLERLATFPDDGLWFIFSVIVIGFVIACTYFLLEVSPNNKLEKAKLIFLVLVIFLPFTIFRLSLTGTEWSYFNWGGVFESIYISAIGVSMMYLSRQNDSRGLFHLGWITIVLSWIVLYLIKYLIKIEVLIL